MRLSLLRVWVGVISHSKGHERINGLLDLLVVLGQHFAHLVWRELRQDGSDLADQPCEIATVLRWLCAFTSLVA